MKKLLLPFFLIALFVSGCIEIQTKVNVNKDGSGTVEETVLMSKETIQMFNEFISGFASDSAKPEEFKLFKEDDLKEKAATMGEGVKYVSGSEIKTDSKEGYKVLYSFTDLNKLRIDQSPDSKMPEDVTGVEVKEKEFVTFGFNKGNVSEIKINLPDVKKDQDKEDAENETEKDSSSLEDLSQIKFLLKDLSISLVIGVDGEITETNADYKEGSDVTLFKLNFGELLDNPEKLQELKEINPNNLKELKDLMTGIPGIKIETNDPVVIKFH